MKPTKTEFENLKKHFLFFNLDKKNNNIYVFPFFKDLMDNVQKVQPLLDKRDLLIKGIIQSLPKDENISIEKITEKYNDQMTAKGFRKISKSLVHLILKKRLFLHLKKKL